MTYLYFYILDPQYLLMNVISITTIPRPKVGSCKIKPQSGIAGETLFTVLCIGFGNKNNSENIFEYYQKDKNDEGTMGKLLKLKHIIYK